MDFKYTSLSTAELLDILTKNTMRYNQILLHVSGAPMDEIDMLREAIKLLQREIEKRREENE
jgi:hypothetical protein